MSRPEQAVWLIEQLNAKGKLSLTFDYSHFAFREMAVEKTVAIALLTGYVVVKDAVRQKTGGLISSTRNGGRISSRPSPQGFSLGLPW